MISPAIIEPIQALKVGHLGNHNPRLHTDETLLALAICAVHDPQAQRAVDQLPSSRGVRPTPPSSSPRSTATCCARSASG